MLSLLSPLVSVVALGVSLFTLWYSVIRRGTVRSTRPAFIALRYDFVGKGVPQAKIFLRTLLFSTAKRGLVVECLFLRVTKADRRIEFSFWGYGDKDLVRGSGLFVAETGIAVNHHFNPLPAGDLFLFDGGGCSLELVAKIVGRGRLVSLWTVNLEIPSDVFGNGISRESAIFFNWSPGEGRYLGTVERRSGTAHALLEPSD